MNKFTTLAMLICACLALASGHYAAPGYDKLPNIASYEQPSIPSYEQRPISSYEPLSSYAAPSKPHSAAVSAAAAAPVEIIAPGPKYGNSQVLRPVLLDSGYQAGIPAGHSQYAQPQNHYAHKPQRINNYGNHQQGYARPSFSVVPAGATLLYPGQNHYKSYSAPVEYSKVLLPVRASDAIAKLYVPENNYNHGGHHGGNHASYQPVAPKY